jgi:hypothetical protein
MVGAVGSALGYSLYGGHPEWLIRVALIGLGLAVFFFSGDYRVKLALTAALLGLAAIVFFYHLGAGSLYDWDEAIYAQVAKEVTVTRDWLTPTFGGVPYWHKPPLYIWLSALAYKVGGVNEFSTRFWSAFFGFGVVALTLFLGARLFSWVTGVTAALLLLWVDHSYFSHWHNFVSQARVGMEAKKRPVIICWIGLTAGLAVMTKSWVGAFALALPFVYSVVTRQVYVQRRMDRRSSTSMSL